MITDQITIMETIPTQAFGNVKLEIRGTLEPGETELDGWRQAKAKIDAAYKDLYQPEESMMPLNSSWTPIPPQYTESDKIKIIDRSIERLEILIDNAKTKEELEKYWDKAVEYNLQAAYNLKLFNLNDSQ